MNQSPIASLSGRPVIVGEVLFDCFPDGSQVLGGAPFNVAWHLAAFGLEPLLVTRLGDDEMGDRILTAMERWGMDRSGVQVDPDHPTGTVQVATDDGGPSYEIVPDRAWDHLEGPTALAALAEVEGSLLYHGTLIARTDAASNAVQMLRANTGLPVLLDLNLRPPWWTVERVRRLLFGTRWLKLNQDELVMLGEAEEDAPVSVDDLRGVRTRFALDTVILTRGAEGATVVGTAGDHQAPAPAPPVEVDTVGAGDAFTAIWITGLLKGWSSRQTFDRALAFASLVCGVRGAVIPERTVYSRLAEAWSDPVIIGS